MSTQLIFLPGMMCDERLFAPQIAELGGLNLMFGREDNSVEAMATRLLQTPGKLALVGLSMGGIVAMEMLRQAPDRIERIALLDTNPLAEKPEVKARRVPQMQAVRDGRLSDVMQRELIPNYLTEGPKKQDISDLCLDMALKEGSDVFLNQSEALRDRPDQTDTLREFQGQALVLCGRDDALCPISRHELMHDLMPQSTLTLIEGAGHLASLEHPSQTTAALHRWLELS
jgi:pimeloyl-ACP methyl ester carboxylesterase